MKKLLVTFSCLCFLLTGSPAHAEESNLSQLQQLQLSESQVQNLFSLFLSRAPEILSESSDTKSLIAELGPQALEVLTPDQRRALSRLAPQDQLTRFGEMSQSERKAFMFDSARGLVHPSKQEWIRRMEEMTK